jgi:glycosyltransferase involved in cell wall biosynthesis
MARVLVLLIGEVLEDPRVHKTCLSLVASGAQVTVGCTDPSGRPAQETVDGLEIVRFRDRTESLLKRGYNRLQSMLHPRLGRAIARGHEEIPRTGLGTTLRNALLGINFRHHMRCNKRINREMVGTFADERFDMVHANDFDTLRAARALKECGAATVLVYDAHEYWPGIGVTGSSQHDAIGREEAKGIAAADHVVTVNGYIAGFLARDYGLAETPAVVMNCPPVRGNAEAVGTIETDADSPLRIIYQGKLQPFRGLPELLDAMTLLPGARLTLAGYGPLDERLRREAEILGIADRVSFTGRYLPGDTLSILAGHHVGVMPFRDVTESIVYASPNKLFDYMMAGLALAGSDLPFLLDIIVGRDLGRIFPTVTPEDIAGTLRDIDTNRPRLLDWQDRARTEALKSFNWESQFAEYPWRP